MAELFDKPMNFYIQKLAKDTPGEIIKRNARDIADLARVIWMEHYTPIIGAAQVEYMLDKFQSADRIYSDIQNGGYVYLTAEAPDGATGPRREPGPCNEPGLRNEHGSHNEPDPPIAPGPLGYPGPRAASGLCGYAAVVPQAGYLLLSKLYVRRDYRGNGVAKLFAAEAAALCAAEYGLDRIRLTVNKYNEGSIAAYKKLGFNIIDSVVTDIGGGYCMDDYIMERPNKLINYVKTCLDV